MFFKRLATSDKEFKIFDDYSIHCSTIQNVTQCLLILTLAYVKISISRGNGSDKVAMNETTKKFLKLKMY
ncbi:hypothetical protein Plhal304r1_c091g0171751 [Plasmopara halstedii]